MRNSRSFEIGLNRFEGFTVEVLRVQQSQQDGNSRIPARYFGKIYANDAIIKDFTLNGLNSKQIKLIIGKPLEVVNRTGATTNGDATLKKLQTAKIAMQAAGLDVSEINQKIAERESEIEEMNRQNEICNRIRREQNAEIKKQIKKLEKAARAMMQAGLDCTAISEQIDALKNAIL